MSAPVISYIIRSALSLAFLYLFFILFLGRERMLKFNRLYLLASLIFSFIAPLITLPVLIPVATITNSINTFDFQNGYTQLEVITSREGILFNFYFLILIIYFSVSSVLMFRFIYNLIRLKISNSSHPYIIYEGHKIVLINEPVLPYSFLSNIYVNSTEYYEGRIPAELFSHEISHIVQRHSLDIIFVELLKVVFWFNPLLLFYKKAIMLNHEYLADDAVTKSNNNFKTYKELLLNIVFRNNNSYLASSFNYSFTKKRLLMMTKNLSKTAFLKKIAVIPLFLALGLLVMNAQDVKPVAPDSPPPPPPPPFGYNMWWTPILEEQKVTPDPSKSSYSQNIYETGEEYSIKDSIVTMKEAFILVNSYNNLYRIIRSRTAIHDLKKKNIVVEGSKIETYRQEPDGPKLLDEVWYKDGRFKLTESDLIAPPPPPPPDSPEYKTFLEKFNYGK